MPPKLGCFGALVLLGLSACVADTDCVGDTCPSEPEQAALLQTAAKELALSSHKRHGRRSSEASALEAGADVGGLSEDLRRQNYGGRQGLWCNGINAVGFDLDPTAGRNGFTVPSQEALQYFHDQGSNCFRVPITWERLQTSLGSDLAEPVDGFDDVLDFIVNTLGDYAIIDPHNNDQGLRYYGRDATRSDFVNLWRGIAKKWGGHPKIIFGLYNEPRYGYEDGRGGYFDPDAKDFDGRMIEFWRLWMQEAIDAIRRHSMANIILVPGLHWTGSRDWSGAGWWGPPLDGVQRSGNTKLALLTDPANLIVYDVHQYMDGRFTGERVGCSGFDKSDFGGLGADWGLTQTIDWAKKYNKKLMMTEIGSWPANDGTNDACRVRMYNFLQRMYDSGVFIGYQIWQFGCPACMADQWTRRPYNYAWYRIEDFKGGCVPSGVDCRESACCVEPGQRCYEKNSGWASCRSTCEPGSVSPDDPPEFRTPWTCVPLEGSPGPSPSPLPPAPTPPSPPPPSPSPAPPPGDCAPDGEDCRESGCCQDATKKCYVKNSAWASCRTSCTPGKVNPDDPPEFQTPWECTVLEPTPCARDGESCRAVGCCADDSKTCFEKDASWASCLSSCEPGMINPLDPPEYRTPWTCAVIKGD